MPNRIFNATTRRAPGAVAAILDDLHPNVPETHGPFNGQVGRMEIVRTLFREIAFEQVLETGTYRAETTTFLAALSSATVYSAELMDRFYRYSLKRTRHYPNITLMHGDSRTMLAERAKMHPSARTFLYLDAHWETDVPRRTELEIVRDAWTEAVVMIDDFTVPGDAGYGAANYGGRVLDESYIPDMPGWAVFYPSLPSSKETGARRGCAVLTSPPLIGQIEAIPMLRRAR